MPLSVPLVTVDTIVTFLLILTRLGGLFLAAPVLSQNRIPPFVKAALGIVMALMLVPVVAAPRVANPDLGTLVFWIVREAAVGALIGLVATFLLAGVATGGQMVGFQMGLTYAGAVDPQFNSQMSPVAEVLNLTALMLFLLMDGHHHLIRALVLSYKVVPAGEFVMSDIRLGRLITASAAMFVVALQIAAPIIILLLLADASLAFLSRLVPQMNIFVVGAPLKIGVGLIMLTLTMPLMGALLTALFSGLDRQLLTFLGGT